MGQSKSLYFGGWNTTRSAVRILKIFFTLEEHVLGELMNLPTWLSGKETFPLRRLVICRLGSVVEHVLGKNEVTGPIPVVGSIWCKYLIISQFFPSQPCRCIFSLGSGILLNMAKKQARMAFGLECAECKSRNYITQKNTTNTKEKLSLKKFCNKCRKSTTHTEYKLK